MDIKAFTTDSESTENGTWLEFDGARFKITSSRGKRFQNALAKAARKTSSVEMKRNPGLYIDITNNVLADVVLLDWEGVTEDGVVVPCTAENKRRLITIPEFRDWLTEAASDMDNFRREAVAEDAAALKSKR